MAKSSDPREIAQLYIEAGADEQSVQGEVDKAMRERMLAEAHRKLKR